MPLGSRIPSLCLCSLLILCPLVYGPTPSGSVGTLYSLFDLPPPETPHRYLTPRRSLHVPFPETTSTTFSPYVPNPLLVITQ